MLFFLDESGDVGALNAPGSKWIVATVIVPDIAASTVEHAYKNFSLTVPPDETEAGEPKGKRLSDKSRDCFVSLIESFPEIMIHSTMLDMGGSIAEHVSNGHTMLGQTLVDISPRYVHTQMREEVARIGRQLRNLGAGQLPRIFTVARAIVGATRSSILRYVNPKYAACFERFEFVLDNASHREDIVFDKLLSLWMPVWLYHDPFETIDEFHERGHPLIDRYSREGGEMNVSAMILDNLRFVDSKTSWGVQMADIASNILLRAIRDTDNNENAHTLAARLLRHSLLRRNNPIGLHVLGNSRGTRRTSDYRNLTTMIVDINKPTLV